MKFYKTIIVSILFISAVNAQKFNVEVSYVSLEKGDASPVKNYETWNRKEIFNISNTTIWISITFSINIKNGLNGRYLSLLRDSIHLASSKKGCLFLDWFYDVRYGFLVLKGFLFPLWIIRRTDHNFEYSKQSVQS